MNANQPRLHTRYKYESDTEEQHNKYDDDYSSNLAAQQAANEAVNISRASLQSAMLQGEQLNYANDLRLRNEYVMQKSHRLIRGMSSWRGWIANLVTSPPVPHSADAIKSNRPCGTCDDEQQRQRDQFTNNALLQSVPMQLLHQASFITNYKANVLLLEQCTSKNEYQTCVDLCQKSKIATEHSLMNFESHDNNTSSLNNNDNYTDEDMTINAWRYKLLEQFQEVQELHSSLILTQDELKSRFDNFSNTAPISNHQSNNHNASNRNKGNQSRHYYQQDYFTKLIASSPKKEPSSINPTNIKSLEVQYQEQEDHLNFLSSNIQELLNNSTSISMVLDEQNSILDLLNDGTDDLVESTKMVTRKADRMKHRTVS